MICMSCAVSFMVFGVDDEHCTKSRPDANTPKTSIVAMTFTGSFINSPRYVLPFRLIRRERRTRWSDAERQQVFLRLRDAGSRRGIGRRGPSFRRSWLRDHRLRSRYDEDLRRVWR